MSGERRTAPCRMGVQAGSWAYCPGRDPRTLRDAYCCPQRTLVPRSSYAFPNTLSPAAQDSGGHENLGVSSGGFSQTGSQNSHTCIPGRLPSGSLWPRGDTTQWARKLSVRARPVLPLPHHLATGKLPGLCFLSYKMKNRTNPTSINAN